MSLLVWPSELPRPARDSWQAQYQDPRQKRPAENGPAGYRRMFSSVARQVSLSITVSRNQKAIFDQFHAIDTQYGTLPFTMPDPTTQGWSLFTSDGAPLLSADGAALSLAGQWLCQFGDSMPSEAVQGIEFKITFSIVVMP